MTLPGADAARLAEAWRIVNEGAPDWRNRYYRQYPNSKASEKDKAESMARHCVLAALTARDAELAEARSEIAILEEHLRDARHELQQMHSDLCAAVARLRAFSGEAMNPAETAKKIVAEWRAHVGWDNALPYLTKLILDALAAHAEAARKAALEAAENAIPTNYQFSGYPDLQRMAQNAVYVFKGYIRALAAAPKSSAQEDDRCPIHKSFVVETDGTRHCNFDGCDWPHGYRHDNPEEG